MKILIISDVAPPLMGGGELYTMHLGVHLTELGHEVHWLTSRIPDTNEYELLYGIHIHRIRIMFRNNFYFPGRQTFPFTMLAYKLDLLKDMDIIQTNTLVAAYTGWRLAKKYKKPSLLFCHEFLGDLWDSIGNNVLERRIYPWIERRIARSPYDWYACPSIYSRSTMINAGCPEKRISIIQHGIDHKLFNPNADGIYFRKKFGVEEFLLFGYIGRLRLKSTTQSKNLMALLQAAKIVTDSVPNSRLALAGAGYEEEMKPVVDKMGLNKKVIYLGNIPYQENSRFLRMCDLIVCPAAADGFCFLLAQASACGVPVVATNVAAHKERVIHMKTGLLVGLSAADIAKAILQLLKDREMNKSFGAAGHLSSENLSWDKSAKKHLQVYEMLISNSK